MFLIFVLTIVLTSANTWIPGHEEGPFSGEFAELIVDGMSVNHPPHDPGPLKPLLPEYYPSMGKDPVVPTDPPAAPVRMCAEWEPAVSVLIRYPVGLPWNLISDLAQDLHVTCLTDNVSSAQSAFTSHGISLSDVTFVSTPTNSYWTRDYGPWSVFDGNDSVGISDHVYNRRYTHGRIDDDESNWDLAPALGIKLWKTMLAHTGGNMMCDGHGRAMSSNNVYSDDNPSLSVDSVNALMLAYWGISNYYTFNDPLGSYINHIDCYAKFLSEEKVVVIRNGVDDAALNQLANYITTLTNCYGRNYEVVRLNCPDSIYAAYVNSLILNNKVYVPVTGNTLYDTAAINFYEREMPGYDAVGYTDYSFEPTDAIHCRTMAIFDPGMLFVDHDPGIDPFELRIRALVHDYSGEGVISDQVFFAWKFHGDSVFENFETMERVTGFPDSFWCILPQPVADDTAVIDYFIQATDSSGRTERDPYTAPEGFYTVSYEINSVEEMPVTVVPAQVEFASVFSEGLLRVEFSLTEMTDVSVKIFDVTGRSVYVVAEGRYSEGHHLLSEDIGEGIQAGSYFVLARIGQATFSRKFNRY
ncbi:agmatine deiminase family protein [candidate division WOR-3 bacterium]|nr:agmatine deiminase family protein [candidate division WOR-3 bacterium]